MVQYLASISSLLQAFCLVHALSLHHQSAVNALCFVTSKVT